MFIKIFEDEPVYLGKQRSSETAIIARSNIQISVSLVYSYHYASFDCFEGFFGTYLIPYFSLDLAYFSSLPFFGPFQ